MKPIGRKLHRNNTTKTMFHMFLFISVYCLWKQQGHDANFSLYSPSCLSHVFCSHHSNHSGSKKTSSEVKKLWNGNNLCNISVANSNYFEKNLFCLPFLKNVPPNTMKCPLGVYYVVLKSWGWSNTIKANMVLTGGQWVYQLFSLKSCQMQVCRNPCPTTLSPVCHLPLQTIPSHQVRFWYCFNFLPY